MVALRTTAVLVVDLVLYLLSPATRVPTEYRYSSTLEYYWLARDPYMHTNYYESCKLATTIHTASMHVHALFLLHVRYVGSCALPA